MNLYNYYLNGLYKNHLNYNFMYGGADSRQSDDEIFQKTILPFFKSLQSKNLRELLNDTDTDNTLNQGDEFEPEPYEAYEPEPDEAYEPSDDETDMEGLGDETYEPGDDETDMEELGDEDKATKDLMNKLFLPYEHIDDKSTENKIINIHVSKLIYRRAPLEKGQFQNFRDYLIKYQNNIGSTAESLLNSFEIQDQYIFKGINNELSIPNIYNKEIDILNENDFRNMRIEGAKKYFKHFDNFRGLALFFRYDGPDRIYHKHFQFNYKDKGRNAFNDDPKFPDNNIFITQFLSRDNKEQLINSKYENVQDAAITSVENFYHWTGGMSNINMVFIDFEDLYDYFSLNNGAPYSLRNTNDNNNEYLLIGNRDNLIQLIREGHDGDPVLSRQSGLVPLLRKYIFNNSEIRED